MNNKELMNNLITALEEDKTFPSTLISVLLKDEKTRTILEKMIANEAVKQINLRFGKPEIDKNQKIICPDCGRLLTWHSYHNKFIHDSNDRDCVYEIDTYGDCVWNNKKREDYIRSIDQNNTLVLMQYILKRIIVFFYFYNSYITI